MEKSSSSQLLKNRKLILVVDLDQTVIHAAVDPTIEKWQSTPQIQTTKLSRMCNHLCCLRRAMDPAKYPSKRILGTMLS